MIHPPEKTLSVEFPEVTNGEVAQDEEFCIVQEDAGGPKRKIRFHDYHEIYSVPGLYEYLFYEKLKCQSPRTISDLMETEVENLPLETSDLVVLDVGAGNGMVGEQLNRIGVKSVVGIDIIEEAAEAMERDRPEAYDEYFVADLTKLPEPTRKELNDRNFNCMVSVSALGFGDIPPLAFAEAYNLVSTPGLVAFNIKDQFVSDADSSGFSDLIERIIEEDVFQPGAQHRYCHRLSMAGDPLYYVAMVGEKKSDIPSGWLEGLS